MDAQALPDGLNALWSEAAAAGQQPHLGLVPAQQQQPQAAAALPGSPGAPVQAGSQRTATRGAEQHAVLVHAAEALARLQPASCWRSLQWAL